MASQNSRKTQGLRAVVIADQSVVSRLDLTPKPISNEPLAKSLTVGGLSSPPDASDEQEYCNNHQALNEWMVDPQRLRLLLPATKLPIHFGLGHTTYLPLLYAL